MQISEVWNGLVMLWNCGLMQLSYWNRG